MSANEIPYSIFLYAIVPPRIDFIGKIISKKDNKFNNIKQIKGRALRFQSGE
jgi:hypothetical protein